MLEEASGIPETVEPRMIDGREDLRDEFIVTIDPDDARDFDDAINVEKLHDGELATRRSHRRRLRLRHSGQRARSRSAASAATAFICPTA